MCITYVEIDSAAQHNIEAIEKMIDYAMEHDIPYQAFNFPIDTCQECGYRGDIKENCPKCNSNNIKRLKRVTGYISCDYRQFNKGKQNEVEDRVQHIKTID